MVKEGTETVLNDVDAEGDIKGGTSGYSECLEMLRRNTVIIVNRNPQKPILD